MVVMTTNSSDRQLHLTRIIGLTGGIGTGKSTVSHYLANAYQLPVLDADIYARVAVELGSPVLKAIAIASSKVDLIFIRDQFLIYVVSRLLNETEVATVKTQI